MSALTFEARDRFARVGLKGPRAAEWLGAQGLDLPMTPNTWTHAGPRTSQAEAGATYADASSSPTGSVLVARLGSSEFFLVDDTGAMGIERLAPDFDRPARGVYPVLREDAEFALAGDAVHEVLAQVCNVNFAALSLESRPVIMTLMIGVAVLVVPQSKARGRRYRIWCDPTFGAYLGESLRKVVIDCGGSVTGESA
jgi:sarcosine oxidase subunit gamma